MKVFVILEIVIQNWVSAVWTIEPEIILFNVILIIEARIDTVCIDNIMN